MWDFFKQYTLDSPCDTTLKWMPRLETEGYTPKNHGWTLNSGTTIMRFGGEQNTDGKQNVYRSLQLTTGTYKLRFHSEGDADKTVGVKIQKLTGKKTVVLNATSPVGTDACFVFSVEDGWGEYRLTISRPAAADQITVTNLGLYSLTEEELTGVRDIEHSSFRMDHSPLMRYDLVGRMTNSKSSHGLCLVPNGNGMVRKILIK